jgi:hypothetical protein
MKLLEEYPAQITRHILFNISQQLANTSFPVVKEVTYQTPQYAIVVNALFFTSLSCVLIVALLAVLALQWVANYDMGLYASSASKRAHQRHIRYRGIEKRKMSEIIAALPLIIFVSLFLFFFGIAVWLWHKNQTISGIVIGGIIVGLLLYTITHLISIFEVEAPFRTPITKAHNTWRRVIARSRTLNDIHFLLRVFKPIYRYFIYLFRQIGSQIKSKTSFRPSSSVSLDESSPSAPNILQTIQDRASTWRMRFLQRMGEPDAFSKREEMRFERNTVAIDSLIWLMNTTEVSPSTRDIFIVLMKELTEMPVSTLRNNEMIKDDRDAIFELLCTPYIDKGEYSPDELEKAKVICKGMGFILLSSPSSVHVRFLERLRQLEDPSISGLAHFAEYRLHYNL